MAGARRRPDTASSMISFATRSSAIRLAPLQPGGAQLGGAHRPLLRRHGVANVILPLAVDLEEAEGHSLDAQAQLLDHPTAGHVPGDDRHFDPVDRKSTRLNCSHLGISYP